MFTLEVFGGLCNRLRAISSGINICKKYNLKMKVIWNTGINDGHNGLIGADFYDVFCLTDEGNKYITEITSLSPIQYKYYGFLRNHVSTSIRENIFSYFIDENGGCFNIPKSYNHVYIRTCFDFYGSEEYSWLIPKSDILNMIKDITNGYPSYCVGIHIRRTDNKWSITNSPIELFYNYIDDEISKYPDVKFYLATDDSNIKKSIINKYNYRIIVNSKQKVINSRNIQGTIDAVIDLYCLANTNKLLGSYWSSFSKTASKINKIPLLIVSNGNIKNEDTMFVNNENN